MRILLIGNLALDRQESMLRLTRALATGFRERGHEVRLLSPEPRLIRLLPRYRYGGPAKFVGYVDKFLFFPRHVRRQLATQPRPDVVHIVDHANAVYAPLFAGLPLVATCNDLMQIRSALGEFPQNRVGPLGRRYQHWVLENIARVPWLACVSTQTAEDLRRLTGIPSSRTTVIPLSLNFPYRRAPAAAARLAVGRLLLERRLPPGLLEHGGRGFIINVGGGQWYKNRRGLLDIYAELRSLLQPAPRLLMVGKPLSPEIAAQVGRLGLAADLVHVSGVSEHELEALYSLAEALIFPSWHEGFGWPVAEAQACGCPVFTSNRAPMTEVGGDAAGYIDPADPLGAARQIARAWPDRGRLSARGLARAAEWDPQAMVDRYLELYERISSRALQPLSA